MTLIRKLSLFAVIALFSFMLFSCEEAEECIDRSAEGTLYNFFDPTAGDEVVITVWLDNESYASALINAFEAANPGYRVNFVEVGSVDTRQRLELFSGSTAAADIVVFPHDHIGQALNSNLLYEITGSQALDLQNRMISSAIQTATACYDMVANRVIPCEGDAQSFLFGAPLSGESVALFYNKTLLEELTGSPEPAGSFEELLAQAELYMDQVDGLFIGLDVGNAYDMHFSATSFGFELFGPDFNDATQSNLNSQAMIDALTWLNGTVRPAISPNPLNSGDLDGESNRTRFESGEMPYIVDGPWSISRYIEAAAINEFEFGVVQLPTLDGQQPVTFSGVQIAAVYKGTRNPDAAFRFLEFMTSTEGLAIMYQTTNKLPALEDPSTVPGVTEDPYLGGISAQLVFSHPMPIIPEMGFFWQNAGTMYSTAWNGTRTPEGAANTAEDGFRGQAGLLD